MNAEAYNVCFLAALSGLCANPAILAESESNGRMTRQLKTMGALADTVAKHAIEFVKVGEE
jgi:hypothetical protein